MPATVSVSPTSYGEFVERLAALIQTPREGTFAFPGTFREEATAVLFRLVIEPLELQKYHDALSAVAKGNSWNERPFGPEVGARVLDEDVLRQGLSVVSDEELAAALCNPGRLSLLKGIFREELEGGTLGPYWDRAIAKAGAETFPGLASQLYEKHRAEIEAYSASPAQTEATPPPSEGKKAATLVDQEEAEDDEDWDFDPPEMWQQQRTETSDQDRAAQIAQAEQSARSVLADVDPVEWRLGSGDSRPEYSMAPDCVDVFFVVKLEGEGRKGYARLEVTVNIFTGVPEGDVGLSIYVNKERTEISGGYANDLYSEIRASWLNPEED